LLSAGRLLKKKGHPFGFELATASATTTAMYPLLWSYGGARGVDKDGKTVLIDSSETFSAA